MFLSPALKILLYGSDFTRDVRICVCRIDVVTVAYRLTRLIDDHMLILGQTVEWMSNDACALLSRTTLVPGAT